MARRTILVIEDDSSIRRGIVDALRFGGYDVFEAKDGATGSRLALEGTYDLVLLDLVLPRREGLDVLRDIRSARPLLPVVILTARGDESDRVKGLELGADDYVVKPFSIRELLARIQAVLRRSAERPLDLSGFPIPDGVVDLARREIKFRDGVRTELSEKEVELLRYLAVNVGRAVSREEIITRLWGLDPRSLDTRTIDMHVVRLRAKLRDPPESPRVLLTVRGKGYMFAGTDSEGG